MSKVALVTGATRGIGRVIAEALGRAGFAVVVTGRTMTAGSGHHDAMGGAGIPGSVDETVAAIEQGGGTALGARLDLTDRASIDTAMEAAIERFGRIDVLVNNGIYQGPCIMQKIADIDMDEAELSLRGNVVNQLYLSRKAMAHMIPQGGGRIIFMTSLSSFMPTVGSSGLLYNAGKAALNKIPDVINFEHGKDGILAFLIEPQFTMTDTLRSVMGNDADNVGFGREARDPLETARTVVWLASHPDAARFAGPDVINAPDFLTDHGLMIDRP